MAVLKNPLSIKVESLKKDHSDLVTMFDRSRGRDHLATLLAEIGITDGEWLFRVCDTYKTRSTPAPLQVRRADVTGVHIWMKFGDNASGVKGVLVVTRDKGITPDELYRALASKMRADEPFAGQPRSSLPRFVDPSPEIVALVLTAANDLATRHWATLDGFLAAMLEVVEGGDLLTPADLLEVLETLVDKGLMSAHKTSYSVTQDGQARLDTTEKEPVVAAPTAPPAPAPKAPAPVTVPATDDTDIVAIVTRHKAKLERLLKLPELVAGSRAKQRELKAQIAKLMEELEKETAKEKAVVMECDPEALKLLLEG